MDALFFAAVALFLWLLVTFAVVPGMHRPPVLALEAMLLTASIYVLGVREVAVLAKAYLLIALFLWLTQIGTYPGPAVTRESWFRHLGTYSGPWWNPPIVIVATLALSAWWNPTQNRILRADLLRVLQAVYAAAVVAILFFWLHPRFDTLTNATVTLPGWWLITVSVLAVGTLLYGLFTREWFVAAFDQVFTIHVIVVFCMQLWGKEPLSAWAMLVPIIVLLAIPRLFSSRTTVGREWERAASLGAVAYRAIAAALFIAWVIRFVPRESQFITLQLVGFALILVTG
ncbi:MAG: hypothetical protein M3463_21815 [Verrucomicrobiota bacterium]|nr:hypothetical protein [Verrucomicrobiota bacterium]